MRTLIIRIEDLNDETKEITYVEKRMPQETLERWTRTILNEQAWSTYLDMDQELDKKVSENANNA